MRFRERQDHARASTRRLLLLFGVVVVALVLGVNALLALLWSMLTGWRGMFPELFFETNTALVLLFVLGGTLVESMRLKAGGGRHVAKWAGGREVTEPRDLHEKRLRNVVDEMALASGQPRPAVFLLDREDAINGFAAGWSPEEAVIAVTRGAIERLTRDELQGLVAHEFGHVQQNDLRLNMILLAMVWGLSLVYGYGQSLSSENEDGHRSGPGVLMGIVFMAVGGMGWIAGQALQAAVSRQREFLADACAVQFTRSRDGIGRTLRKIWQLENDGRSGLREARAGTLAPLFLSAPPGWLALHPPHRERIKRIYGHAVGPMPSDRLRASSFEEDVAAVAPLRGYGVGSSPPAGPAQPTARASFRASEFDLAGTVSEGVRPLIERARFSAGGQAPSKGSRPLEADLPASRKGAPSSSEDRDAMGRLALLHGPLERRSALLALLIPAMPPGPLLPGRPTEQFAAWRREASALPTADRVMADVRALSHAARVPWFEKLLARTAAAPASEHKALIDASGRVLEAGGGLDALGSVYRQVLSYSLPAPTAKLQPALPAPSDSGFDSQVATELAELSSTSVRHVAVVTALLDELVPAQWHWYTAVMLEWEGRPGLLALRRPHERALDEAFAGLRQLPWMLRPLVLRLWVTAALARSQPAAWPREFMDGLRLCSVALDCPLHPDIASAYTEIPG